VNSAAEIQLDVDLLLNHVQHEVAELELAHCHPAELELSWWKPCHQNWLLEVGEAYELVVALGQLWHLPEVDHACELPVALGQLEHLPKLGKANEQLMALGQLCYLREIGDACELPVALGQF
jgi:hypothetical protein